MVGIGPGGKEHRTLRCEAAIREAQVVAGYTTYTELISDLLAGKEVISTGMTREVERVRAALQRAAAGKIVALVSSGDPGIYGMAGLALEMNAAEKFHVAIEIVPGLSAANMANAILGAPLMLDFATLSLSNLLVSWEMIRQRLEAVAAADLVVALYNPKSKGRTTQIEEAAAIFLKMRSPDTPVAVVTAAGCEDQTVALSTLGEFLACKISMRSVVIIGNSTTRFLPDPLTGRNWMLTPRGYELEPK